MCVWESVSLKGHWRGENAYKETLHKPAQSVGPGGGGSDACCKLAQEKLGPGAGDVDSCALTWSCSKMWGLP